MREITQRQNALLSRVIGAGDEGLEFKTEPAAALSDLITLALEGLIRVPRGASRVYPTEQGKAFALRVVT